jgi:hypothetical protein
LAQLSVVRAHRNQCEDVSNQLSLALEVAKLRIGCPRAERPFEREASQMLKDAVSISRVEASGEGDHDVGVALRVVQLAMFRRVESLPARGHLGHVYWAIRDG